MTIEIELGIIIVLLGLLVSFVWTALRLMSRILATIEVLGGIPTPQEKQAAAERREQESWGREEMRKQEEYFRRKREEEGQKSR